MDNNNTHKKWTDTPVLDTVINAIDTQFQNSLSVYNTACIAYMFPFTLTA